MRTLPLVVMGMAFIAGCSASRKTACETECGDLPVYYCIYVAHGPTVDGKLDDAVWQRLTGMPLVLATSEAVLVASYARGAQAISASGGCTALLAGEGIARAPVFSFVNLIRGVTTGRWHGAEFEKEECERAELDAWSLISAHSCPTSFPVFAWPAERSPSVTRSLPRSIGRFKPNRSTRTMYRIRSR